MLLDNQPYTLDRVVRMVLRCLLLIGVVFLLNYLSDVLLPFAVACLLAYLLNPLVTAIQRRTKSRVLAVSGALLLLVFAIFALAFFLIPMILAEFADVKPLLQRVAGLQPPAWLSRIMPTIDLNDLLKTISSADVQRLFESERFMELVQQLTRRLVPGVWSVISGTISVLLGVLGLAIVLLYTIFLLIDYERLRENWVDYLPASYRVPVRDFLHDFNEAMKRYFRGQALIAFIVGCMFSFGFWLIGLPMALFFGLLIGLLNMIPYLQIVGMIPVFAVAFISGMAMDGAVWRLPLLALLVLGVVQSTQDLFLTPRILGRSTGLSPALILLSLAVWGKLLGMLGLLIAIPMTCLLLVYYRRILAAPGELPENIPEEEPVE